LLEYQEIHPSKTQNSGKECEEVVRLYIHWDSLKRKKREISLSNTRRKGEKQVCVSERDYIGKQVPVYKRSYSR
jgi:hypothetical protein